MDRIFCFLLKSWSEFNFFSCPQNAEKNDDTAQYALIKLTIQQRIIAHLNFPLDCIMLFIAISKASPAIKYQAIILSFKFYADSCKATCRKTYYMFEVKKNLARW